MNNFLKKIFALWQERGYLALVYLLLAEALVLGFVVFAGLFTVEMLLPTFITARLSLTKFFFFLLVGLSGLLALGHRLGFAFENTSRSHPLFSGLFFLWGIFILLLSLYKFPLWSIPLLLLLFLGSGYLFWNIFFENPEKSKK